MNSRFSIFTFSWLFFFSSCQNLTNSHKEILAQRIASESCSEISQLSSGIVSGLISGLANVASSGNISSVNTGSLGEIPPYWCDCFIYYVSSDLSENFSENELIDIQQDYLKKIMVLQKIIALRQEDMKNCIAEGTEHIVNDYDKFAKDLNKKF